MTCDICAQKYTNVIRKATSCLECQFECCVPCLKRNIQIGTVNCPNCKKGCNFKLNEVDKQKIDDLLLTKEAEELLKSEKLEEKVSSILPKCPKCDFAITNGVTHVCKEEDVISFQEIMKNTKPCPKCSTRIMKTHGCYMMFCTNCNAGFSWETLERIDTRGEFFHNGHYTDFKNENNIEDIGTYTDKFYPFYTGLDITTKFLLRKIKNNISDHDHTKDLAKIKKIYSKNDKKWLHVLKNYIPQMKVKLERRRKYNELLNEIYKLIREMINLENFDETFYSIIALISDDLEYKSYLDNISNMTLFDFNRRIFEQVYQFYLRRRGSYKFTERYLKYILLHKGEKASSKHFKDDLRGKCYHLMMRKNFDEEAVERKMIDETELINFKCFVNDFHIEMFGEPIIS